MVIHDYINMKKYPWIFPGMFGKHDTQGSLGSAALLSKELEEPSCSIWPQGRKNEIRITWYQMLLLSMHVQWRLLLPKSPEVTSKQIVWFSRDTFIIGSWNTVLEPNMIENRKTQGRRVSLLFACKSAIRIFW